MPEFEAAQVAAMAWCESIRRQWLQEFPGQPCPIPAYRDLPMQGRRMFNRAFAAALRASSPDNLARIAAALEDGEAA